MLQQHCMRIHCNPCRLKTILKTPGGLHINSTKPPKPGVAEQRIAKSPHPARFGAIAFYFNIFLIRGLSAIRLNVSSRAF